MTDQHPITQPPELRRINLRVNERLISILADLKEQKGMTMPESIRKGVGLLHIAMTEQSKGRRLAFIDEQSNVVAEVHAILRSNPRHS